MKWVSALSRKPRLEEALQECAAAARRDLDKSPDLTALFVSAHFSRDFDEAPKILQRYLPGAHLFGCSAGGVIGAGVEAEEHPAVGLMAASLPDVSIIALHLEMKDLPDMDASPRAWADKMGVHDRTARPHFLLLADPFSFNPEDLTRGLDYAFPGSVAVGGLASGAGRPGGNVLYLDGSIFRSGAVGVALLGNVAIDPIVAQGCRPVGRQLKITDCEENRLLALDNKTALEALSGVLEELPSEDQELARTSLFLGLAATPLQKDSPRRDYLIRNIIGLDPERGVLAVGSLLRPGQTVQFHLRDKRTSAEDLARRLRTYAQSRPATPPSAAFLFSCVGRGLHLYGTPNHDTDAFLNSIGRIPLGGFFCNGEIGPVGGSTYVHGYTACFGVIRPKS